MPWAVETAQLVKVLASKPDNLSLMPRTDVVKGDSPKSGLPKVPEMKSQVLIATLTPWHPHIHVHTK